MIEGEVNRAASGSADMIPLCYGNVSSAGAINVGGSTGNFNVARLATGIYEITIIGETYHYQLYGTLVTPIASDPAFAVSTSGDGKLYVRTYNLSGAYSDTNFQFLIFKR